MSIVHPIGTTVTDEIEPHVTDRQRVEGLVLSADEVDEYHVGTVVEPDEQDIARAREEICDYEEPDHDPTGWTVVDWGDEDGPDRQWVPSEDVIRISVAA